VVSVARDTARRLDQVRRRLPVPRRPPEPAPAPVQAIHDGSMLPYYAYRAAESLVRVLPQRTSYWLGDRVADVLLLAAPRSLDPLRDNLRHVLPDVDERRLRRVVRRNIRNLTHSWVDVMSMSSRRTDTFGRIDIEHLENFLRPRERGRGVVVVSMHYGCWEVGIAGWNAQGGQMALLAEVLRPMKLFERVISARGTQRVQVIPIDVAAMRAGDAQTARRIGAASMREVFRVLRGGGVVAMAIDRDLIGNGVAVPFFGKPAPIPIGVVDIAIRAGSAVVPIILYRNDRRVRAVPHAEVAYDPEAPREQEVRRVTGEVLRIFERAIRAHPDQWHVLERIWTLPERA
jgi:phosphatidylinositol dimannoside acyltransferase